MAPVDYREDQVRAKATPTDEELKVILAQLASRVVDINDATRTALQALIVLGRERGYSLVQLANGVPDENFAGIRSLVAETYANRGGTIARTELAYAQNWASSQRYADVGVEYVEIMDGDGCGWTEHDDPDEADGSIRTLDDLDEYPIAHPNCGRVPLPIPPGEVDEGEVAAWDGASLVVLKYRGDQARDDHGRFADEGGVGLETEGGTSEVGIALSRSVGQTRAQFVKANQILYDSDQSFKTVVDAVTLYTQGSYEPIQAGSEAALTGERQLLYGPGSFETLHTDRELAAAANPMATYKNYFAGQDVDSLENDERSKGVTVRDAGKALQDAISGAEPFQGMLYRGERLSEQGTKTPDDMPYEEWSRVQREDRMRYEQTIQRYKDLNGEVVDMLGVTSFTTDKYVADQFAIRATKAQGNHGLYVHQQTPVIWEIEPGARGLPVQHLSPYKQQEVLTAGRFRVLSVTTEQVYAKNAARGGAHYESVEQLRIRVRQEATWKTK